MTTRFCPICGGLANYSYRNCLFTKDCYNAILGKELSLETIHQVREQLGVRLSVDEHGISECYKTYTEEDGNICMILLWIVLPGGHKRYICQKAVESIGSEAPKRVLELPEFTPGRGRGRPEIMINIPLVRDLVYNKGISRRKVAKSLGVNYATLSRKLKESVV